MFSKVVISLCASVMLFGCPKKKSDDTETVEVQPESSNTVMSEVITVVATNSEGVKTNIETIRYNFENLSTPESIVVHKGDIYVSNIGGQPGQSPDMGFITKFDGKENIKLCDGAVTLNDPKGFAFMSDNYLLISNHPNVTLKRVMDNDKCADVKSLPIDSGAGFLNDVARLDNNTAFVTDTGKGLIYKVTINEQFDDFKISIVKGINHNGINGVTFDPTTSTLYFVTSTFGGDATVGDLYSVQLDNNFNLSGNIVKWNTKQIGAGGLDGIALLQNDKLVISDWGKDGADNSAMLFIYDIPTKSLSTTISGDITSTADITVDGNIIYMPEFSKNRISTIDIGDKL